MANKITACAPPVAGESSFAAVALTNRAALEAEVRAGMFKSLADHSQEFIGMCDMNFRPFYANAAGMRMVGLDSLEQACAVKVQDFFFPEDQRYINEEFFPKVLREGRAEVEIRFRHFKTGAALWMIYNVFQVRDADGRPSGYATVSRDITSRKLAEDAVQSAALIPEENPFPVLRVSAKGTLLFANRSSAELLTAWGCRVGDTIPEGVRMPVQKALETGVGSEPEVRIGERVLSFVLVPILESGYANLYGRDVTEWKRAEEQAAKSGKMLSELIERCPFGIYVVDADFRIAHINTRSQEGAFRNVRPVIGTRLDEALRVLWPEDVAAEVVRHFRHTLSTGEPYYSREFINPRNDSRELEAYEWELHRTVLPDGQYAVICYYFDSTELRLAQAAVRQSEERLRLFIEHAPASIAMFDRQMRYLAVSNRWVAEYLPGCRSVIGECHYELFPDCPERWRADHHRGLAGEVVRVEEDSWTLEDGRTLWMRYEVHPWYAGEGVIGGIVIVTEDTTSGKLAQEALRASGERLRLLSEVAGGLLGAKDPQTVVEELCTKVMRQLECQVFFNFVADPARGRLRLNACAGIPAEQAEQLKWLDYGVAVCGCVAQEGCRIVAEEIGSRPDPRADLVKGFGVQAYACHPLMDGTRVIGTLSFGTKTRVRFTPDELGLMKAVADHVAVAMKRKQGEEALRTSEARLAQAVRVGRVGTFELNLATGLFTASAEMRQIFGFSEWEPVTLAKTMERVVADDRERVAAGMRRGQDPAGDGHHDVEHRADIPGRGARWISARAQCFFEGEGSERHPVRTIGAVQDITEQKEFQAELQRLVDERTAKLHELVGELEHFSYTITHDLKAPLRAMRGFAEIAATLFAEGETERAREFLGKISTAAERMDRLIADALSYSRSVRQELPLDDVDVGTLLRGILDSYPQFQPWQAQIRVEGELPVVLGNEAGLTQCLSNLLGNAVKFVKAGQKPEIRVWATQRDEWVRIWVEDKGIGMSTEMVPRAFEMFSRGSRQYEGTGIGLALVLKVVQRMGGRVGVESEEGRGSRFWIELGRGEARQVFAPASAQGSGSAGKGAVLYVEDEESDVMFMELAFAEKGLTEKLHVAGTGRAAIDYLSGAGEFSDRAKHPVPTVVLLDLNLPQISGFGVLEWIRNHPDYARLPVVVFSSSTRDDDRTKARELGADDFLTKPSSGLGFRDVVEVLQKRWVGRGAK